MPATSAGMTSQTLRVLVLELARSGCPDRSEASNHPQQNAIGGPRDSPECIFTQAHRVTLTLPRQLNDPCRDGLLQRAVCQIEHEANFIEGNRHCVCGLGLEDTVVVNEGENSRHERDLWLELKPHHKKAKYNRSTNIFHYYFRRPLLQNMLLNIVRILPN